MDRDRLGRLDRLELRETGDGLPSIVGYAAVFYREDDPGTEYTLWAGATERIMPGAFDRAVKEDDVAALRNHNGDNLLGRSRAGQGTLILSVDDTGLRYEIKPSDVRVYAETLEMIKRGDLDGSSFQFQIRGEDHWIRNDDGSEVREVREVKLFDVGPVTFPAYTSTTTSARSARDTYFARDSAARNRVDLVRRRLYLDTI